MYTGVEMYIEETFTVVAELMYTEVIQEVDITEAVVLTAGRVTISKAGAMTTEAALTVDPEEVEITMAAPEEVEITMVAETRVVVTTEITVAAIMETMAAVVNTADAEVNPT